MIAYFKCIFKMACLKNRHAIYKGYLSFIELSFLFA